MTYRIEDEPQPSALAKLAVNPVWPLLAVMFGGAVVSWPWFALNGFALGSPSRRREAVLAVAGFAGSAALAFAIFAAASSGYLDGVWIQYSLVVLVVWKLAVSYWLYVLQGRSFGLYQLYGGTVRNGLLVVFAAALLKPKLLGGLPTFLVIVLS